MTVRTAGVNKKVKNSEFIYVYKYMRFGIVIKRMNTA
jgi:hypothetical protein